MPAASKIMPWGYLTQVAPGPFFVGVEKPMKVYSFDNVLITSAKVPDEVVYKILDMMEKNKADLVAVQPVLRECTPAFGYKQYGVPYHPGALKYFKEQNLTPQAARIETSGTIRRLETGRREYSTWKARSNEVLGADCSALSLAAAMLRCSGQSASAQTYGFATMQPGTLNHTSASAIAKVLKEKGGMNMLVQPTAGESVLIPMVAAARPSSASPTCSRCGRHPDRQAAERPAHHRLDLHAAHRPVLGPQGHRHEDAWPTSRASACRPGYSAMRTIDTN